MVKREGTVLVVEDDEDLNALVGAYIEIEGFRVRSATEGREALRCARELHPDVIILDVMLPDVDGFEVCRRLKNDERTHEIPVVMLTALDQREDRERGFRAGADAYLTKPFDPDRLLHEVRERIYD